MHDFDDDDLHVDLTSLIDVIFMLVIFFIMTMSFTLPQINLNVPTYDTAVKSDNDSDSFTLTVDSYGSFFIEKQAVSLNELHAIIKREQPQSITLYLDPKAPAQSFIDAADLSRIYTSGKLSVKVLSRDNK